MKWFLAIALTGCVYIPKPGLLPAECGMHYGGIARQWHGADATELHHYTPEVFRKEFQRVLPHLLAIPGDPRLANGCKALEGYGVFVHTVHRWYSAKHGYFVEGITDCQLRTIEIGDSVPRLGSLAHELVHAMQNCTPVGQAAPDEIPYHHGWKETGIQGVLDQLEINP